MKYFTTLVVVAVLCAPLAIGALADPGDEDTKSAITALRDAETTAISAARWDAFSDNLTHALKMDNDGVRMAAMQLVIRHGANVDVKDAIFDVVRVYRGHEDDNMRRLAVVTLGQMQSPWAIGFLRLSEDYETSDTVRQTIRAVVADHKAAKQSM